MNNPNAQKEINADNDFIFIVQYQDDKSSSKQNNKNYSYKIKGLYNFSRDLSDFELDYLNDVNQHFNARGSYIDFINYYKSGRLSYCVDGSPMVVYSPHGEPTFYFSGEHDVDFYTYELEKDWYLLKINPFL